MERDLITEVQDLGDLGFEKAENAPGVGGSFLKALREEKGRLCIYKCPDFDPELGFVGHEGVNELVAARLMKKLGIRGADCSLIHGKVTLGNGTYETWVTRSETFLEEGQDKISLELFYEGEAQEGETPLDFCIRRGFEDDIYRMLILDFLILNRDRHGKNLEVIRDRKNRRFSLAPLFDQGLCLLFRCRSEKDMELMDTSADRPVHCFVGGRSPMENLKLIPPEKWPKLNPLTTEDIGDVLKGLDAVMPQIWMEKAKEMLQKRYALLQEVMLQQLL